VVVVTVQGLIGDGSVDQALLNIVSQYLSDDDRRPVADRLTVQSATVLPYQVDAVLYLATTGPEAEPIREAAQARLVTFINQRRRLGVEISESAIHAALHVEGVRKVVLHDWADITPSEAEAAFCTRYSVTIGALT
jgi:phage-related baseplate assembly protein